jgi:hypothetical protein
LLIATKSFDAHQVENRVDRADIGLLSEALVSIKQDYRLSASNFAQTRLVAAPHRS